MPPAWSLSRSATISAPEALSRFPVGSSARTRPGRVTTARARQTRCFSPPESWSGRWPLRGERPTESRASAARARRSAAGTPARTSGKRDVLERRHPRDEVERLEDEADPLAPEPRELVVGEARDLAPLEAVRARGRPVEAAEEGEERRLPRARGAHDRDVLPCRDRERHVAKGVDGPSSDLPRPRDARQLDHRVSSARARAPSFTSVRSSDVTTWSPAFRPERTSAHSAPFSPVSTFAPTSRPFERRRTRPPGRSA